MLISLSLYINACDRVRVNKQYNWIRGIDVNTYRRLSTVYHHPYLEFKRERYVLDQTLSNSIRHRRIRAFLKKMRLVA